MMKIKDNGVEFIKMMKVDIFNILSVYVKL